MTEWWQTYFDADYLRFNEGIATEERSDREVDGLWALLGLRQTDRVLDAPCGYGRISARLARRGAVIVGVDFSSEQLDAAQRQRGDIPAERLRYLRQDLRQPLHEQPFDAALNIFTSLGYGTEADDMAVLSTLRSALRAQGRLFIETAHRDRTTVALSHGQSHARRLSDNTAPRRGRRVPTGLDPRRLLCRAVRRLRADDEQPPRNPRAARLSIHAAIL